VWYTVVVVDDDAEIRAALVDLLVLDGYRVLTARDGLQALEVLATAPRPCVALVDLVMPRLDGWTLARTIAEEPALCDIAVVCCTAARADAPAGCAVVLRKPFGGAALEHALAQAFADVAGRGRASP